ncbi:MAG: 4Fe-4S binding protein [Bacillota bacterium]
MSSGIERQPSVAVSGQRCVHCGACTSICPSGALSMDAPAWTLVFHPSRCNACRRCVGACPVGAISASGSSGSSG